MVIINLSAILTLLAALLIGAMVFEVLPDLSGDARMVAGGAVLFFTSLIAETIGLAPRVFLLIPPWMVAL
ncbi:MAG: hypothetical protein KC420_20730, partial [Myxococcales bacterium]|nr:hypothetical protein [Myxococcales bacterium]